MTKIAALRCCVGIKEVALAEIRHFFTMWTTIDVAIFVTSVVPYSLFTCCCGLVDDGLMIRQNVGPPVAEEEVNDNRRIQATSCIAATYSTGLYDNRSLAFKICCRLLDRSLSARNLT